MVHLEHTPEPNTGDALESSKKKRTNAVLEGTPSPHEGQPDSRHKGKPDSHKRLKVADIENNHQANSTRSKKSLLVQTTLFGGKPIPCDAESPSTERKEEETVKDDGGSPSHTTSKSHEDDEDNVKKEVKGEVKKELDVESSTVAAQVTIHDLATKKPVHGGSPKLEDESFNPALVPHEEWAYYTQKGASKEYHDDQFLFAPLATTWQMLEDIKQSGPGSKTKAISILTNFFRLVLYHCPHELIYAAFLCLHRVAPDYAGVEIGIGESLLIRTICETYGRKEAFVKSELEEKGDLGEVAQSSRSGMSLLFVPSRLTIRGVFTGMKTVAEIKGNNAQIRKRDQVKKMLVGAVKNEPKFVIRFLEKNLRTGVKSMSVLSALAFAFILSPPERSEISPTFKQTLLKCDISKEFLTHCAKIKVTPDVRLTSKKAATAALEAEMQEMEQAIRQAYSQVPHIGYVIYHLLCGLTAHELREQCVICPGVPVSPMLAKPTKGLADVLEAMEGQTFVAEYKYDGERIQIHKLEDGNVHLFSRNLEVLDNKYPDVKEVVCSAIQPDTRDFILDAEVVAFDRVTNQILPFQVLSGRKRKDVDLSTISVTVHLYVFDCLRHNGEVLVATTLENRKAHMQQAVKELPTKLSFAKGGIVSDTSELELLLLEAIDAKTEGLMVKIKDGERSYYEPSKRSINWLKLKKDYLDTLGDSVDLVPIGAFWGRGRRSGAYGGYLLAVYDSDEELYRSVCKVATGFTDEDLTNHYNFYKERVLTNKPSYYHISKKMTPDVWLEACQVWECKAADLSISPVHTAAWESKGAEKGIGLRFPRYLKIREDKKPEQATDSRQILDMYEDQFKNRAPRKQAPVDDDEDDLLI